MGKVFSTLKARAKFGPWLFALYVAVMNLIQMNRAISKGNLSAVQEASVCVYLGVEIIGCYVIARAVDELARKWQ